MNIIDKCAEYIKDNLENMSREDVQFKDSKTFEQRLSNAEAVLAKYPGRIPVICERATNDAPKLDRKKYLIPVDFTMGGFLYIIRKRMTLPPEKSIYLFVGDDSLVPVSHTIGNVYDKHRDEDKFLYIKYSGENTFG